jgi:hypothetical protein
LRLYFQGAHEADATELDDGAADAHLSLRDAYLADYTAIHDADP